MSWDVSILRFERRYLDVNDIPYDAESVPLGSLAHVQQAVAAHFPGVTWNAPQEWGWWGIWESANGSIEFNMGDDDPVEHIGLHVRAESPVVVGILALAEQLAAQAMDSDTGRFLDVSDCDTSNPNSGLASWRRYRDQVLDADSGVPHSPAGD